MSLSRGARRRLLVVPLGVLMVALALPAVGQEASPFDGLPQWDDYGFQGEGDARLRDVDARQGTVLPTAAQEAIAAGLGSTSTRWNEFGTPHVLTRHGGYLSAPRKGAAADVARDFVRDNAELFRLGDADVDALVVLRESPLYDSPDLGRVYRGNEAPNNPDVAHVVMFRQQFGSLEAALDGTLTVGVQRDGRVAWVSSSVTGDDIVRGDQRLDAGQAVQAAAADVGLALGAMAAPGVDGRYTTFASELVKDVQRARLVALPTPLDGLRRAFEVTLLDTSLDQYGNPTGVISYVDAESGQIWQRSNKVEHLAQGLAGPSTMSLPATQLVPDESGSTVPLPTWRVFPANPPFVSGLRPEDVDPAAQDTRVLWCWDNDRFPDECDEEQRNDAARTPWDVNGTDMPSFTTDGNFASTAISEVNTRFAGDTFVDRPFSPTREYDFPFGNKWFQNSCDPTQFGAADSFVDGGPNDEAAATANLFAMHNRVHDWSYFLGFTEVNSNLQKTNFGNTGSERANDPELGASQAARRTVMGRDNANQTTLQDGLPAFTNQFLWQPLAGAFYAPCVDGAYDQAVVAHEYGHAITNRMIGGPDVGTGATQGQTESWSDLAFAAYFTEFQISAGEGVNPYVLGPYVTGDLGAGIRNYPMNDSPLNYSNLDYDPSGLGSPHANGEIWSAANFDILSSLNVKYDGEFPSTDVALQTSCARGERPADECPGNRRWNQIQFDSFLLQPSGSTMVDSRDGMLAADMLRFDGANQDELWDDFAARGLGENAFADGPRDVRSLPSFESPLRSDEAQVNFTAPDGVTDMRVFAGRFEANTRPVADTVADTELGDSAAFVPGRYEFIATAPGSGAQRFTLDLASGQQQVFEVPMRRNHASAANGAAISGDGVNLDKLIDDTEQTNWASFESEGTATEGKGEGEQVNGREVVVELAGEAPVQVTDVQVSAALRPVAPSSDDDEELPTDPDPGAQSRFSALRAFDLFSCNAAAGADCTTPEAFTPIFSSPDDAFPSTRPRPRIPDHLIRPFEVTETMATHIKMVVRTNQCTGGPDFQGEVNPDNDPAFNPDCDTEAPSPDRAIFRTLETVRESVRASELQVFSSPPAAEAPPATDPGTDPATGAGSDSAVPVARPIEPACPDDTVPRNSRTDIAGNTHERAIDCMIWYEIAKGTSDELYGPFAPVRRDQMAGFVARLIERGGGQLPAGDPNRFSDVGGNTHEDAINKLAFAGVVDGTGDGLYNPAGTVSRAQMAKFLVQGYEFRAERALATPTVDYFPDDTGNTHEVNINKAAAAGFTVGRSNGNYEPAGEVRRDAMASFLARTLTLLVEQGVTPAKTG